MSNTDPSHQMLIALEQSASVIVEQALSQFYTLYPHLRKKHGERGMNKCREDCHYHLEFLGSAIRQNSPQLFVEYIRWVQVLLESRSGSAVEGLAQMVEILGQGIRTQLGESAWSQIQPPLDAALKALQSGEGGHQLYTLPPAHVLMHQYLQAILKGDRLGAQELVLKAYQEGMDIRQIYLEVFQPALYEVGRRWEIGQVSVAQEHLATAITQTILSVLYAQVSMQASRGEYAIVACLSGNMHQVGPRMVADFLQLAGYDTLFLGAETPQDSLLTMIEDVRPQVVGLPSTLALHTDPVRLMIDKIRADFVTYRPVIMVGGLTFNLIDGLWKQVRADVWGRDAGQAIDNLIGAVG